MGLRQTIQQSSGLVTVVSILVIALGAFMIFKTLRGQPKPTRATRAFYSVDDGKTWFADDIAKVPPFKTAEGKDAVAAVVATCGQEPFVMYLWKYTPEGKEEVEQGRTNPSTDYKREVKRPGDTTWVKTANMLAASKVQEVHCPPGQSDFALVDP